jgi:hypothetical protein
VPLTLQIPGLRDGDLRVSQALPRLSRMLGASSSRAPRWLSRATCRDLRGQISTPTRSGPPGSSQHARQRRATSSASPRTAPPRECCAPPRGWQCTPGLAAAPLAGLIVRMLKVVPSTAVRSRRCRGCTSKSRLSHERLQQGSRGTIVANKRSVISPVADYPPRWQQGLDSTRNTLKRAGRPSGQTREPDACWRGARGASLR